MAKKTEIGPTATYLNLDGSAPRVTFHGVSFKAGKPVDLIEALGETKGAAALAKLAGNHFFDVAGSDADHDEIRERINLTAGSEDEDDEPVKASKHPGVKKGVAKRIAKEKADDEHDGAKALDDDDEPTETKDEELPDDVKTPDKPQLETAGRQSAPRQSAPRRPRLPRAS